MIYLLDICQDPGSLKIILFIKELINIIFIVVPIGLIVFIAIDMFKNTVNTESEDKKNLAKSIKRLIFCVLLFLVPTIVNATVDLVQQVIGEIPYVSCWSNATKEKVESLAITQAEEKLKIAKDKKTLEAITEAQTAVEQITDESKKSQYQKEVDELNKELKQKLEEEKQEKKDQRVNSKNVNIGGSGNTQAASFNELGDKAYKGDEEARQKWIDEVGKIVQKAQWEKYGIKNSLIIAQIINESGWMHTPKTINSDGSTLTNTCNNVLGINYEMVHPIEQQTSTWSKNPQKCANASVTQRDENNNVYGTIENMRKYNSIEECIEDYADLIIDLHPECRKSNNIEDYRSFLNGYTPIPKGHQQITDRYIWIISKYNLEKYDL